MSMAGPKYVLFKAGLAANVMVCEAASATKRNVVKTQPILPWVVGVTEASNVV